MKKLFLILVIGGLLPLILRSQPIAESTFKTKIEAYLKTYRIPDNKIISKEAFDQVMKPIFSKIILNSEDAIKNGNSISFINNADKSTISVNSSLFLENHKYQFINIGFNGNASNDFLSIKDKDKSNYGIEGSFTHSFIFRSTIFYNSENKEKLAVALDRQKSVLMANYMNELKKNTTELDTDNNAMKAKLTLDIGTLNLTEKEAQALVDSITKNEAKIKKFKKWESDEKELNADISKKIANFEVNQAELSGHSVRWFEYSLKPSIQGIAYFDTSIVNLLQEGRKDYFKGTVTFSWNHARNTKHFNWYYSAGLNLFNSYFFEGLKSTEIEYSDIVNRFFVVKGYDVSHTDPDATYVTIDPFVNGYIYPFTNKTIGFELATDYKICDLRNTHTFKVGVLFSIADKDGDVSKGTVGIFFTGKNIDYSEKVGSEFFSYGFRVGLPVNKIISMGK